MTNLLPKTIKTIILSSLEHSADKFI